MKKIQFFIFLFFSNSEKIDFKRFLEPKKKIFLFFAEFFLFLKHFTANFFEFTAFFFFFFCIFSEFFSDLKKNDLKNIFF